MMFVLQGKVEAEGSFEQMQTSGMNFAKLLHQRPDQEADTEAQQDTTGHSRKGSISVISCNIFTL